jgi:polysaccharide export outer membrane protein
MLKNLRLFLCLGLVSGLMSCAAVPGQRYSGKSDENVKEYDFQGNKVRLHRLNIDNIKNLGNKKFTIPQELTGRKPKVYRIGVADVLLVKVWEHPELTTPLGMDRTDNAAGRRVGSDSCIFYPYAGILPVVGLTAGQVRDMLLEKLSKVLKDPQIDVQVVAYRSKKVYLSGEVTNPGIQNIDDVPMTLAEALGRAGGYTSRADAGEIYLSRGGKQHAIDMIGFYETGTNPDSILLQHGDMIRVPTNNERKVYVMGEVASNTAVPMNNGRLSLVQALAEAGGFARLSVDAKSMYVIRWTRDREIDVFHLNARSPLAFAIGDQFALQPKDVVYVDEAGLSRWNRFISLILPTTALIGQGTQGYNDLK